MASGLAISGLGLVNFTGFGHEVVRELKNSLGYGNESVNWRDRGQDNVETGVGLSGLGLSSGLSLSLGTREDEGNGADGLEQVSGFKFALFYRTRECGWETLHGFGERLVLLTLTRMMTS